MHIVVVLLAGVFTIAGMGCMIVGLYLGRIQSVFPAFLWMFATFLLAGLAFSTYKKNVATGIAAVLASAMIVAGAWFTLCGAYQGVVPWMLTSTLWMFAAAALWVCVAMTFPQSTKP